MPTRFNGYRTYQEYLGSHLWRAIRAKVLRLQGTACWLCGAPHQVIHHLSYGPRIFSGERVRRLVPLCHLCHRDVHFFGGQRLSMRAMRRRFKKLRKEYLASIAPVPPHTPTK